jgi:hypothetical protein
LRAVSARCFGVASRGAKWDLLCNLRHGRNSSRIAGARPGTGTQYEGTVSSESQMVPSLHCAARAGKAKFPVCGPCSFAELAGSLLGAGMLVITPVLWPV